MQITKRFLQYIAFTGHNFFLHSSSAAQLSFRPAEEERAAVCCPHVGRSCSASSCLADLLQELLLDQFELHAHGHLGDKLLAAFLRHLFTVSQVDVTDASAAFEIGQRLVRDPVTDCRDGKK